MPGPILDSGFRQIEQIKASLPDDAKAALILRGDIGDRAVVIGTAANLGKGWVLSLEAELAIKQKPGAQFAIGKVWK